MAESMGERGVWAMMTIVLKDVTNPLPILSDEEIHKEQMSLHAVSRPIPVDKTGVVVSLTAAEIEVVAFSDYWNALVFSFLALFALALTEVIEFRISSAYPPAGAIRVANVDSYDLGILYLLPRFPS